MRDTDKKFVDYIFTKFEEYADAEAHDRGMKDIQEHGTISLEEMDKAMGV